MKNKYSFTAWVNRLTGTTGMSEAVTRGTESGRIRRRIMASVITLVVVSYSLVNGQTIVWGGTTGTGLDWTLGANWSGGVAPADGADVVFDTPGTIEFSTLPSSLSLNSLTVLQGTVTLTGSASSLFTLGGNAGTDLAVSPGVIMTAGPLVTIRLQDGATADINGQIINSGVYDCGAGSTVTTVNGNFTNKGTMSNTAKTKMIFSSTAVYDHAMNSGTFPIAAWDVTSTCTVTGAVGTGGTTTKLYTIPAATMPLGNFTWNSTGQVGAVDLGAEVTTVAGDFTVTSTGSSNIQLGRTVTGAMTVNGNYLQSGGTVCIGPKESTNSMTLNVDGNFTFTAGSFYVNTANGTGTLNVGGNLSSGSSFYYTYTGNPGIGTVNVDGNFSITAGTYNMSMTESTGTLNIGGNVTIAAAAVITETGTGAGAIYLNGTGMQSWSSNGSVTNSVNITVNGGSYMQMDGANSYIAGAGVFTLSPGATLGIRATDGITAETATATGHIRCTGGRVFSSGASYIYNGTAAQVTGTGLAQNTPANLSISNSAGVSLSGATTISGLLTMTTGTLNMSNNNLIVGSLTGSSNITNGSISGVTLTVTDGTAPAPYSGVISNGSGTIVVLVKMGSGTLTLSGENTFTGPTIITGGVVQLGSVTTLSNFSSVVFNGGTLSTGATTGYSETVGTLDLDITSSIALGTGVHSLTFSNSSAESWNSAATLTVTGWTGNAETSGTAGKIFVGSDATGLTAEQLAQINFTGYGAGAVMLSTGEIVPTSAAVITLASSDPAVPAATITQSSTDNVIYAFSLGVASGDVTMTGLQITMDGLFSDMDITNIKAWYSADNSFSAAGDVLLSTTTGITGPGTYAFTGWSNQTITSGTTAYVFVTADIPCDAMVGSTMMVAAVATGDVTFDMGSVTGTASAGGEQTVSEAIPADVTSPSATPGDGITELSWTNPSCYDLVMIVAKDGSAVTETPTGDGSAYTFDLNYGTPGTEFDGGFIVYIGDVAPETVAGLANGSTYYFTLFTKRGVNWSTGVTVSATPVSNATYLYRSAQSGAWETPSTWQISTDDGQSWVAATTAPDNTYGTITIQNGHTVTLNSEINVDQMTVATGGQLTVASGLLYIVGSAEYASYINGTMENRATVIASGGELVFNSGSLYRHNRNGGGVPVATWDTASTCEITGITSTFPVLADAQSFGNFTWNCTAQSASIDINGKLNTVKGNLTIASTNNRNLYLGQAGNGNLSVGGSFTNGGGRFILNPSNVSNSRTMNVAGNFANNSGYFFITYGAGAGTVNINGDFSNSGTIYFTYVTAATATLNIDGNATISGGSINMSGTGSTGTMTIAGSLTHTAGTITEGSTGRGLIIFDGTAVQTYTASGTEANSIDYLIPAGGAVTLTGNITSGGTFTINSEVSSSGSLIANGSITSGVTYNRQLNTANYGGDRHYLSSPVGSNSNANASKVVTVWGYQESDNTWPEVPMTTLESGKGYNLDNADGSDGLIAFTGTALTGSVSVTLTSPYLNPYVTDEDYSLRTLADGRDNELNWGGGGWNLVGNPYTSALDAMTVIGANASSLDPHYYAFYVYDAGSGSYDIIAEANPGNVQAGQGFWVMANNNNVTFTFSPSQRIHGTGLTMLKSAVSSPSDWPGLKLRAKVGTVERSTRLFYNDDMKAGLDPGYDVGLLSSGAAVEVYTLLPDDNGVNLAYQSLPETGCGSFIIPVGVDCKDGGEVTFTADIIPLGDYVFYLEDRVVGKFTDLSLESYKVTLPANTLGAGRFFLYASNSGTPTGVDDPAAMKNLHIWYYDRSIIVKGEVSSKAVCEIYDTQGRMIYKKLLEDQQLNSIPVTVVPRGVYIVVVRDGSKVTTQKVAVL